MRIHNSDFSYDEVVELVSISEENGFSVSVGPGLFSAPLEGYIMDTAQYDNAGAQARARFCFSGPEVDIIFGASGTEFDVSSASRLFVGAIISVQNPSFTDLATSTIIDITGSTITVDNDLGFTPTFGYTVTRAGYASDEGTSYLYL